MHYSFNVKMPRSTFNSFLFPTVIFQILLGQAVLTHLGKYTHSTSLFDFQIGVLYITKKKERNIFSSLLDTKPRPNYMLSTKDSLYYKDTDRLKGNIWQVVYDTENNPKKAGVALLISHKVDFRIRNVIRNKDRYTIMINRSIP